MLKEFFEIEAKSTAFNRPSIKALCKDHCASEIFGSNLLFNLSNSEENGKVETVVKPAAPRAVFCINDLLDAILMLHDLFLWPLVYYFYDPVNELPNTIRKNK